MGRMTGVKSRIEEEHIDALESVVGGRDAMEIVTLRRLVFPRLRVRICD